MCSTRRRSRHRTSPVATLAAGLVAVTLVGAVAFGITAVLWIAADLAHVAAGLALGIASTLIVHRAGRRQRAPSAAGEQAASMSAVTPTSTAQSGPEHKNRKPADMREPVFWGKQRIGWMDATGNFIPERKPPLAAS